MMVTKRPFIISCAGCNERREFRDGEALAAWAQSHQCWAPAVHPSLQPEQKYVGTFGEVVRHG